MDNIIISSKIKKGNHENIVQVTYYDGTMEDLITYYPDEISFEEREFVSLTRDDAVKLHRNRDLAYLQNKYKTKKGP